MPKRRMRDMKSRTRTGDTRAFQESFGEVLRNSRRELGISQEEFAASCGLHRTYISIIERGEKAVSLKALFSIAKALRTKPHKLISEAEKIMEIV